MTDGGIAFCVSRRKKQQKPGSNGTIFSCQGFGQRVCWVAELFASGARPVVRSAGDQPENWDAWKAWANLEEIE